MKDFTYLLVDIFCVGVPFLASFYPKHPFYKEWRYFFPANLLVAGFFLIWDQVFTFIGIWGFNRDYLMGFYLGSLPLEEILFFICIPYSGVFTWFSLKYLIDRNPLTGFQRGISIFLIIALSATAILSTGRWYTFFTFIFTSVFLLFLLWRKKDLSYFYLSYIAILPFFFISNGLLTGSWIENPIVWYNNSENLGIRMGTIPVEDLFYGLLLILMNVQVYQYFKERFSPAANIS